MPINFEWSEAELAKSLAASDLPVTQEAVVVTSGSSAVRADFIMPSGEDKPPYVFEVVGGGNLTTEKAMQVIGMAHIVDGQVSVVIPAGMNVAQEVEEALNKNDVKIIKGDVEEITSQIRTLYQTGSND